MILDQVCYTLLVLCDDSLSGYIKLWINESRLISKAEDFLSQYNSGDLQVIFRCTLLQMTYFACHIAVLECVQCTHLVPLRAVFLTMLSQ